MDEQLYWLWLSAGLGAGAHGMQALLAAYGADAEAIYASRMDLLRQGMVTPSQQRILATTTPDSLKARLLQHEEKGVTMLCYTDVRYPSLLKMCIRDRGMPMCALWTIRPEVKTLAWMRSMQG